jgi:LysM repeat protein
MSMLHEGRLIPMMSRALRRPRAAVAAVVTGVATVTAVVAGAGVASAATVTVQPGQNLTQIAAELHTTVTALVAANHIANPDRVLAGSVLQVPVPGATAGSVVVVVVGRGDTLTALAARYRTSVAAIAAANGLGNPNRVLAGSKLTIPVGDPAGMALASYDAPATGAHYPAALLAHPSRLSLQPDFAQAASTYGVPVSLLEALCWWESGWQESVVSPTRAIGVCQIEPSTAAFVNTTAGSHLDPHVASQNIDLGAWYLATLLRATGGNASDALAGYYQGLGSVRRSGMLPSTTLYVHGIEAYAAIFAG